MTIIVPHGFEPNYTAGFVKGLVANGVDACVISSDTDHRKLQESGIRCANLRGGQDHARFWMVKVVNLLKYYMLLVFYLFRQRRSVVHFTGLFRNELILFEGLVLNSCFRMLSRHYIYTVHNVLPHSKEKSLFFRLVYRFVYKIPQSLLVHTQLAKHQLVAQFSVPDSKIIVISIGLNEEMPITEITREDARRRLGFTNEEKVVLFFGKADEYKGLDTLLAAFDRLDLPRIKLLIAGWFPDPSYRRQIVSAIDAARHKADIHLHEAFIPNAEVENYFKSADVLVLPYKHIYQSGVVFLCFNFGLPVVATDVGSLPEFIDKDMGIITKTNDAEGVADGLQCFFAKQSQFRQETIIEKAKKYKWDRICKILLPLYQLSDKKRETH